MFQYLDLQHIGLTVYSHRQFHPTVQHFKPHQKLRLSFGSVGTVVFTILAAFASKIVLQDLNMDWRRTLAKLWIYTTISVIKGRLKLKIWIKLEMVRRVNSQEERYLFTLHVIAVPIWDSQIRALLRLLFSTPSSACPLFCPHLWSEYFLYFSLGKVCKTEKRKP